MLDVFAMLWIAFYIGYVLFISVHPGRLVCGPRAWWGHRAWAWVPANYVITVVFIQLLLTTCGRLPDVLP